LNVDKTNGSPVIINDWYFINSIFGDKTSRFAKGGFAVERAWVLGHDLANWP
jgi:hypothetical protein